MLLGQRTHQGRFDGRWACDAARAFELGRNDRGEELRPNALNLEVLEMQPLRNVALNVLGGRVSHGAELSP